MVYWEQWFHQLWFSTYNVVYTSMNTTLTDQNLHLIFGTDYGGWLVWIGDFDWSDGSSISMRRFLVSIKASSHFVSFIRQEGRTHDSF